MPISRARLVEILGVIGSVTGILVAIDYYLIQSSVANIEVKLPLWGVALITGPLCLAAALYARHLRLDALARPARLVSSDDASLLTFVKSHDLLSRSNSIDLSLYTAETVLHSFRFPFEACKHPLKVRMLVRRPENDPKKREIAEGCLKIAREITSVNSGIEIDFHFYDGPPLLRSFVFCTDRETVCLSGVYRYDLKHPALYVGAEFNQLFVLDDSKVSEIDIANALRSRFELSWNETSALRAALFDLDGVLLDSMEAHYVSWRDAFESVHVPINRSPFRKDIYQLEGYPASATATDLFFKYMGVTPSPTVVAEIVEAKEKRYAQGASEIRPFDGMVKLLQDLRSRHVPLALVSGAPRSVVEELERKWFSGLFAVVITGSDISAGKPDARPFSLALDKLGISGDKGAAVAIENAPLGVQSALAAGLTTIGILRNSPLEPADLRSAGAHYVFSDTETLSTWLAAVKYPSASSHIRAPKH